MTAPVLDPSFRLSTEDLTRRTMHRIYWRGNDPLAASVAGNNRYDCSPTLAIAARYGVLYFAFDLETCWMETVVRANMVRPAGTDIGIPRHKMTDRWACEVVATQTVTLARFADEPLIDLGDCASNIMGDGYDRTSEWSQLLQAHANPLVDGIHYRSRFKTDQFCVALFERAIAARHLGVHNARSVDPATSAEAQSIMRRFHVIPTWPTHTGHLVLRRRGFGT